MRQSAFTIMTTVRRGADAALSDVLTAVGEPGSDALGLALLGRLHYCSFSLVAAADGRTALLFEGNVDGEPAAFLDGLARRSGPALATIYRHCEGCPDAPDDPAATARYLVEHDIGATTFFVAWPGLTVDQVRRDDELRRGLRDIVDGDPSPITGVADPVEARRVIVEEAARRQDTAWALDHPPERGWTPTRAVVAAAAGLAVLLLGAPVTVPLLVLGAARLRLAEVADDRRDRSRDWEAEYAAWSENLEEVRRHEDVRGQNHLASVAAIKPGPFRWILLRAVLGAVTAVATVSPPGSLVGIPSIHFARWTITPDRRLIFLSNFDGSWESYLGDFIDLEAAVTGLTAVWSNTDNEVGFPHTTWLIGHGARDEARFKAFARRGMVRTYVWFSAYPDLSVVNISNNVAVRRGLHGAMSAEDAQTWLRRL